ncbi:hypothetical protein C5167_040341 [Papaver somniferum]|uniref:Polyphenol oxidase C-terminal domain-containing protein n=1 Tax=Papaver somniferum TaxID=3469 RepID=A0A4Y7IIY8_PAPSO|nr:hypothetical protein C5167_040341 [Papaver somniferum]
MLHNFTPFALVDASPTKEECSSASTPTTTHDHDHHQNDHKQLIKVEEFGSQTRKLETPIRALVKKPKVGQSMEGRGTYVLSVEGIDVLNDEPVRFDVFVAKHQAGDGDDEAEAGPDSEFGKFAGSLVELGGSSGTKTLDLGISYLIKDIQATDCDNLVVTLKPRSGQVSVGSVRVEYVLPDDDDEDFDD